MNNSKIVSFSTFNCSVLIASAKEKIMNKLTSWILSALFLVFGLGFSQPSVFAQTEILPETTVINESGTTSTVYPVALPVESVSANVARLLQTNECIGCNLTGAVLKDANLQAANLENANLQNADLERANLQQTNLLGANLQGADLGKVNIAGANLENANLFDADLEKANLQGANLQGANLEGADLQKTNLLGANIQGANFRGADLEDAMIPPGMMLQ
jgi:uncharacterized protein YjbI with pentapeptide repeats